MALTKAHPRMVEGTVVNVFDFMTQAQIDDVTSRTASIDVSTEIQSAVDSLPANGTLFFPYGTYGIATEITIDTKYIAGAYGGLSQLKWISASAGTMMSSKTNYFGVRDMFFDGDGVATVGFDCGPTTALGRNSSFQSMLFNCWFEGIVTTCFNNKGSGAGVGRDAVDLRIIKCTFKDAVNGLILRQPDHAIDKCTITDCTNGISIDDNTKINITDTIFTLNTNHLYVGAQSVGEINAVGSWFENGKPIEFLNNSANATYVKNLLYKNCHFAYPEDTYGSSRVVDLRPIGRGIVNFHGCVFASTDVGGTQFIDFGATGGVIDSCSFHETTGTEAVRYNSNVAGSVIVINSNGKNGLRTVHAGAFSLNDGITAPATISGAAQIYVDTADGDLKVKFGDGTVKTIVTDT